MAKVVPIKPDLLQSYRSMRDRILALSEGDQEPILCLLEKTDDKVFTATAKGIRAHIAKKLSAKEEKDLKDAKKDRADILAGFSTRKQEIDATFNATVATIPWLDPEVDNAAKQAALTAATTIKADELAKVATDQEEGTKEIDATIKALESAKEIAGEEVFLSELKFTEGATVTHKEGSRVDPSSVPWWTLQPIKEKKDKIDKKEYTWDCYPSAYRTADSSLWHKLDKDGKPAEYGEWTQIGQSYQTSRTRINQLAYCFVTRHEYRKGDVAGAWAATLAIVNAGNLGSVADSVGIVGAEKGKPDDLKEEDQAAKK